ncbi:MAG TPA: thymidine phosphorylase [Candidatus Baltobacteraceae bacterium]|jgi:pyrimidine-nucleoside phosphorylase|nr:thymidine phosphorylase [Candidatus Baltobacteraceae bacterium]
MNDHAMRRCIERKREGGELTSEQWHAVVDGFMDSSVDDAQMAALCMACVVRGMSFDEAHALTDAMVRSGEVLAFDPSEGTVVDKHSTGGVSDIVSLAAIPTAAACGARVAKLSGRALGHTGGTIDKLEAVPGFTSQLAMQRFEQIVRTVGCAIAAQTQALAPADKRLYHLRDHTATIPSLGLIASSILSKKIAGGAHAFVFDVKTGAAAFVPESGAALELARWLVQISASFGKRATAFVTDMHQPLGRCIGSGIELIEARDVLRDGGEGRARELILAIAAALVEQSGKDDAADRVERALRDGSGYRKFIEMIAAQGGDVAAMERMTTGEPFAVISTEEGYVDAIDVVELGHVGRRLSQNDPLAGLRVHVQIGDYVRKGDPLVQAFGKARAEARALSATFRITPDPAMPPPLIYDVMTARYPQ